MKLLIAAFAVLPVAGAAAVVVQDWNALGIVLVAGVLPCCVALLVMRRWTFAIDTLLWCRLRKAAGGLCLWYVGAVLAVVFGGLTWFYLMVSVLCVTVGVAWLVGILSEGRQGSKREVAVPHVDSVPSIDEYMRLKRKAQAVRARAMGA